MKNTRRLLLCSALGLLLGPSLQGVDFTGSYTQNFDSMGTGGTTAPAGWSFHGNLGGSGSTWTTSIPAADAVLGTLNATLISSTATSVKSSTQGYNWASASAPSDRALATSPTTHRGVLFQLTLTNATGGGIGALDIRYDTRRASSVGTANELPGHWLFYSLDGGASWTVVASLSPTLATVPNSAGVSAFREQNLTLPAAWPDGANLLLRWIDDNAAQTSPDQIVAIDNVSIATASPPPTITSSAPADLATIPASDATLEVAVSDPEARPLTVTFYGRAKGPAPGPDFTLITLPDTQYYSQNNNNRFPQFTSQTNWIVSAKSALNVAFVAHMGDMVQNGDSIAAEWIRADSAMDIIENPTTTLLTHGIPWGGAPGNHDQQPIGSPDGASVFWNQYFGVARWAGRPYFGGTFGTNNDNNYQLFSASGLDFIIVNLEYRPSANQPVLDWAGAVLKAHPGRRAIVTSHWLINTGNPASWGGHGAAVYDALKDNPNLFLMLCGHIHGEGQRADVFEGRTVRTFLQDYQDRADGEGGGGSWLRYYTFSPTAGTVSAKTYRTTADQFETDADSQFSFSYDMSSAAPWTELGTVSVPVGSPSVQVVWNGIEPGVAYEWYASVSNGVSAVGSVVRSFTAGDPLPVVTISASDAAAGEHGADQALAFTITRAGSTTAPLAAPLVAGGSATAEADYTGFSASVEIPAGSASTVLPLTVLPDELAEGAEIVTISIGSSPALVAGSPASADAAIADRPAQDFYFQNIADPARRAPDADGDGDGQANVLEYFMGTLPGDAASRGALTILSAGANEFVFRFPRSKNLADVTGVFAWSSDLATWRASGESDGNHSITFGEVVVSPAADDPETVEVTGTISGAGAAPKAFLWLGVE